MEVALYAVAEQYDQCSKSRVSPLSTVVHRNGRINTSSNSRFVDQNLKLRDEGLLQIGKKGKVQEE